MRITELNAGDNLTRVVLAEMLKVSAFLPIAEFYEMTGNADTPRKASAATGGSSRALNSDFSANQVNPAFGSVSLKIFGDKIEVDIAHDRRGNDIGSVTMRDLQTLGRKLGRKFDEDVVAGDTSETSTQINGMKNLVDSSMVFTPNAGEYANGLTVSLGNGTSQIASQQQLILLIDELIENVEGGAQFLALDGKTKAVLTQIGHNLGLIRSEMNEFGQKVTYYDGVELSNPGFNNSYGRIISQNEAYGTAYTVADVTSDVITATNSTFSDGDAVVFGGSDAPGALVLGTVYYVRDASSATFKVAATPGGSALTVANAGTATVQRANSTSIYAGRYSEGLDLTIATSNGFNVLDLGVVGVHQTYNCEMDIDQALLTTRALGRLKGVLVA